MTAIKYIGGIIRGTAAERGTYTTTNLNSGWIWIETDTLLVYLWSGSAWALLAGSKSFGFFRGWVSVPSGTNSVQYFTHVMGPNGTETNLDFVSTLGFTLTRFRAIVISNAKNGNTIFSFRDDAADVAVTPLTVGAAATGEFDSGALSVAVAAGSKIAFRADCSASSSGAITAECIAEVTYSLQ